MRKTETSNKLKIPQINLPSQKARVGRVHSSPVAGDERGSDGVLFPADQFLLSHQGWQNTEGQSIVLT